MKNLAVVLLTYASGTQSPRHQYALRTAHTLAQNIKFSGNIRWHIADDGSPDEHILGIKALVQWENASVSCAYRQGYGASYNLATQILHSNYEYLLMVEDDWELTRVLDIDPLIKALDDGLNCIRLGYIGWTQQLKGSIEKYADQSFLVFDPDSAEPHVWSGHPRIETRSFQRAIGEWPVGHDPGTTEFIVAQRKSSREKVAWPLDLSVNASQQYANLFAHIGAVQARQDQLTNV